MRPFAMTFGCTVFLEIPGTFALHHNINQSPNKQFTRKKKSPNKQKLTHKPNKHNS